MHDRRLSIILGLSCGVLLTGCDSGEECAMFGAVDLTCPEPSDTPSCDVDTTHYQDLDGDGYGNSSVTIQACGFVNGYSSIGGDCDDTNPSINPSPSTNEACDGLDNDCDGIVDDKDIDRDGHEDYSCGGDDCDDTDPDVYAGAIEIVTDGQDNDCDGVIDENDDQSAWVPVVGADCGFPTIRGLKNETNLLAYSSDTSTQLCGNIQVQGPEYVLLTCVVYDNNCIPHTCPADALNIELTAGITTTIITCAGSPISATDAQCTMLAQNGQISVATITNACAH